jgi:hypothetical protein
MEWIFGLTLAKQAKAPDNMPLLRSFSRSPRCSTENSEEPRNVLPGILSAGT